MIKFPESLVIYQRLNVKGFNRPSKKDCVNAR